ncbi:hypothetical protein F2Q70_00002936 [Brassica cretica]|uniref:Uncharacterized protein n=1 Tax=Brassica cretica TaxID=69181 RepID=A0A8S9IKE0_BRACR|nr:hypothetical protein F2Q70_00002936 [Brassica cretica]
MASRRSNPRDSDRVQTRTGSANAERIRSGDVSEALTEVLREEIRLPLTSTQEAKDLDGEKSVARVKSSSPTELDQSTSWTLQPSVDFVKSAIALASMGHALRRGSL